MTVLLDTHVLLWILTGSERLRVFPWLDDGRPWTVSPISILELQYLSEVGRIELDAPRLTETLASDPRFTLDEPPLMSLVEKAIHYTWTRDPFDRLLAAHSAARRLPLCTLDRTIRANHSLIRAD